MSKENYDALQAVIAAIPASETKVPNMPVDKFLQEAADLEVWSAEDQLLLIAAGVSQTLFDELPERIGALRYAQSLWMKERYGQEEATRDWGQQEPLAEELKNELEHTFRYAFRSQPELLQKVQVIEDGNGYADLVQDLSDLSVLGNANVPLLEAVGFDTTKLATAASTSQELSNVLAAMNGERADGNAGKVTRDQAYTYLKQAVDEIRAAGKFVFWKDETRKKGYFSKYLNKR